jgi:hypothetical protein
MCISKAQVVLVAATVKVANNRALLVVPAELASLALPRVMRMHTKEVSTRGRPALLMRDLPPLPSPVRNLS